MGHKARCLLKTGLRSSLFYYFLGLLLCACAISRPAPYSGVASSPVAQSPKMIATTTGPAPVVQATATISPMPDEPTKSAFSTSIALPSETPTLTRGSEGAILWPRDNQILNGLVMDDQFVYFSAGPGSILRQTLDKTRPIAPEFFAKIQYPDEAIDGSMQVMPRLLKDHWLYYVDMGDGTITDRWTLRAKNTVNLVEKVISKGNGSLSGFSVDGDTIALNYTTADNSGPTVNQNNNGDNILVTIQISSGQIHEIDRAQKDAGYSWSDFEVSGNRLLAAQISTDPLKGPKFILFDVKNGTSDLLSNLFQPSMPENCAHRLTISGQWIACNSSETETYLYNLTTHQHFSLSESLPTDDEIFRPGIKSQDGWLYWTGSSKGDIYDLARNRLVPILTPRADESIGEMTIYGTKVAWLTLGPSGYVIGWMDIPQE